MVAAAASYYKATLVVTTGLSAPFNNLAVIYKQQVVLRCLIFCFCVDAKWMLESPLLSLPLVFNEYPISTVGKLRRSYILLQ